MLNTELTNEIERLKAEFKNADESKLRMLDGLIEQAAYERIFLKRLDEQAAQSGLVQFHPENTTLQRALPVSGEIARHSAALTNILDKLCKWLMVEQEEADDGLGEYE